MTPKKSTRFIPLALAPLLQLAQGERPLWAQGQTSSSTENGKPIIKRTVSLDGECPLIHPARSGLEAQEL